MFRLLCCLLSCYSIQLMEKFIILLGFEARSRGHPDRGSLWAYISRGNSLSRRSSPHSLPESPLETHCRTLSDCWTPCWTILHRDTCFFLPDLAVVYIPVVSIFVCVCAHGQLPYTWTRNSYKFEVNIYIFYVCCAHSGGQSFICTITGSFREICFTCCII